MRISFFSLFGLFFVGGEGPKKERESGGNLERNNENFAGNFVFGVLTMDLEWMKDEGEQVVDTTFCLGD